ncbi:putative transmembrane protein [Phytophthora cinnamomi]|uniref:putative transmembrane protein n=1 Tax=Phytophthora cinnamomi TaxID=4785 RepID=UPI00355A2F58|nr:putative transmembrane protein [Phytophthora cinnamomi]
MTAAAPNDRAEGVGQVLPQLRLKRPTPAQGVLSPPRSTQPPPRATRLTQLSDAAAGFPCARLVEWFLYCWTVVATMLGIVLACLVLYLMYFTDGGNLAPVLPFSLAAYGGLAITVACVCGLYGLLHHRQIVTEGRRNYSLGVFVFLGIIGAIVVVVAGAMALSLSHVVELAQNEDFSSDQVAVLETKVISKLHDQVTKSSSTWREIQDELKCCGYDQISTIQTYLSRSASWNAAVQTEVEDVNAVGGSYCSTRPGECLLTTSEAHCPVSGRDWCRLELLQVAHDNYLLLSTCAITFGAFQLLFSLLGVFTLLCDVRRISGLSPTYEIPHRMLSPIQPSAPNADD